ncbi:hypothetical protein NUH86_23895 (plasmid) [Sphingobium sp. JS3065]|uniref:hypothetical protein n=1 Tax=Sphingobium sp. JS3065 TaxID=2970925 RepID=UPI002263AE9B|nr:hypothetical protein [Sphingobium sp. JS3065]UZW58150.1 hypothetical protein NUH86_23895 [Sphingobium sp. JS3065]
MISIVNTECHVPKTFSDLAKIAAWGRLGLVRRAMSFSAATVAIWSVVASIFLTPLGEAAACGLRL